MTVDGPQEYLKNELMEGIEHLVPPPRPVLKCSAPEPASSSGGGGGASSSSPKGEDFKPKPTKPRGEPKDLSKEPPKWFKMGKK